MKKEILIGPILIGVVWLLLSSLKIIDTFFLPNPIRIAQKIIEIVSEGSIFSDLFPTVGRVFISFLIASIIGLPLGLFLGYSKKIYSMFEFVIDFFRSTPATALFPLFLLIFGITDISKIAVAAFSAMLIIIFNTAYGVIHAKKSRILAAQIMGATKTQIFRWILFWESLPQTFIGLRSAASMSLMVIIVTEMFIGTTFGLGRKIIDAQITYDIPLMYAVIILSGILGYGLNLFFILIERKLLHWNK
ncbi:MAG: ABC transporter permease [Patescibacteria group bacterium]